MMASDKAFGSMIPYYLDVNGDPITVRILLFKGDHFVLKQKNQNQWLNQNCYKNFRIVISPYYCSPISNSSDPRCVGSSEKVNVFVKNSQNFQFQTTKDFVVENINFDFTDSIISDQMDTDN